MDRIDFEILEALQNDARISNKELSVRVGLAPSTCLERVRRLRESGVLMGFHADVDPEAFGLRVQAMITVRVRRHSRDLLEPFREHLRSLPEVIAVYYLAGADDFRIHVATKNAARLRDLVLGEFTARDEIGHMETQLIFECEAKRVLPRPGPGD